MNIRVWIPDPEVLALPQFTATLTTEASSSSYGIPVLRLEDENGICDLGPSDYRADLGESCAAQFVWNHFRFREHWDCLDAGDQQAIRSFLAFEPTFNGAILGTYSLAR